MADDNKCPIWGLRVEDANTRNGDKTDVSSARAGGKYSISRTAESMLSSRDSSVKARLTTWIVEQHRLGKERPFITPETIEEAENRAPISLY